MTTYSNPRMEAVILDWPTGATRTTATFRVETHPTRGQRRGRTTINPKTGKPNAIKFHTYADQVRIVDGDDGKTYLIEYSKLYNFVNVMQGNLQFQAETIWPREDRFSDVLALFGNMD